MSTPQNPSTRGAKDMYLDSTYLDRNPTWDVEDSAWKARQVHGMLARHRMQPKTVAEIGCGAGEILKQLSLLHPATAFHGYELSPQAYELCRSRASAQVSYFLEDLLDKEACFDVLLCIDVFEHVEDYIGFLRALKPKATHKIFHIPLEITVSSVLRDTMMNARRSVGHLHYFTPRTALATLEDSGYQVVDYCFTPSFDDLPPKSLRSRLARIPRKLLYAASPALMVKLLGGCSLLVLAK
ncbi:MAG: class I SAM-dependent methyltransferase [Burkholderiales bacterium]|nr:class I SAM-dependent methyltransferase [Burkholderiales bacterium]